MYTNKVRLLLPRICYKSSLRTFISTPKLRNLTRSPSHSAITSITPISTTSHVSEPAQRLSRARIKKYRKRKEKPADAVSGTGVLLYEITQFAEKYGVKLQEIPESLIQHYSSFENHRVVEDLEILAVSSSGDGLAFVLSEVNRAEQNVVVVPFTTTGDVIQAKLGFHTKNYIEAQPLRIIKASRERNDYLIKCNNFMKCSGCQLQMLSYKDQLKFKTDTVRKAYERFGLESLDIDPTVGSPDQYHYRSKLTPHFNANRKNIMIGFEKAWGKGTLNIDSCEIATPVLSEALSHDRSKLEDLVRSYKKGGTILLRDKSIDDEVAYTTDHREVISQKVGDHTFRFPAGEFFQNNNSILPTLLEDIKQYIKPTHKTLIDTYCGSGFFGISLSQNIETLIGIEISKGNLEMAQSNAELNKVKNSRYILGSSEEIFTDLGEINPEETVVVLDPSRKGSTESYLTQLSKLKPDLIVYVSCNVFSQARDMKFFLESTKNGPSYEVLTVKGYDFFPQTRHVESLAVMRLKREEKVA